MQESYFLHAAENSRAAIFHGARHPRDGRGPDPIIYANILAKIGERSNYICMSKDSNVKAMLPAAVERHLSQLGEHIHIARKRRKESLAVYAARMQVSIPTLRKVEAGDPSVSMAAYATALWMIGRVHLLSEIANPETDEMALLQELRTIKKSKGASR
jgi:DNA-binding transcriptional regulator YiaG